MNDELVNIENFEDEKEFLENIKNVSLHKTEDSDFLYATRYTCCGFMEYTLENAMNSSTLNSDYVSKNLFIKLFV